MSYPSLAPGRRSYDSRRRRRRMIWFVLVSLVVALIVLAVRYRTEERQAVDYMAAASEIAQREAGLAESLTQMLTDLGAIERQDLLNQMDTLGARVSSDAQLLAGLTVPATVAEAHGFLTVAVTSWRDALTTLDDAVLAVLDSEGEEPIGAIGLTSSFDLLRLGDKAYAGFLEARSRLEGDAAAGPIAEVVFVTDSAATLFNGETIATRLRAIRSLGGRHDISVTARTVPEPLGTSNGRPVVPSSESFAVLAVITNEGNLAEEGIAVTLELSAATVGSEPIMREQLVLILDAGEATTVEFSDLVLVPGELYDLQITASIAQDAEPLNNIFELVFFRNQDA